MQNQQPLTFPQSLIDALRSAGHVAVLTGAGISAESGIPTFRDKLTGLWARYNLEELATTEALRRDPALVWSWLDDLRATMERAQPNPAHLALVAMEQRVPRFTLITQNIDSLHQRAGSQLVYELHGNVSRAKCARDGRSVTDWQDTGEVPPRCPHCGGLLRQDVVLFGELLPEDTWMMASVAAQQCDVFLAIGTSGVVEPAASLARYALHLGATVVIMNLDVRDEAAPPLYKLHGRAGEVLPALVQATWGDNAPVAR